MPFSISVILPTHNPRAAILNAALESLRSQTLPRTEWELIIVDNASSPPVEPEMQWHPNAKVIRESRLGLTSARECGFRHAEGEFIVMVDDDNLLDPDYLSESVALLAQHPKLGAIGGKSIPRFEETLPHWWEKHLELLLACRDLGEVPQISTGLYREDLQRNEYPSCAPHGAGMVIRRVALENWLSIDLKRGQLTDRRGSELTSGGDNDIVLSIMRAHWEVGYFPSLSLVHLIPATRMNRDYLKKLNRGIAKSWVQVLHKYAACPWEGIAPWTVPLRKMKAWFIHRPWTGPIAQIRWHGVCGHFEGLASLPRC